MTMTDEQAVDPGGPGRVSGKQLRRHASSTRRRLR